MSGMSAKAARRRRRRWPAAAPAPPSSSSSCTSQSSSSSKYCSARCSGKQRGQLLQAARSVAATEEGPPGESKRRLRRLEPWLASADTAPPMLAIHPAPMPHLVVCLLLRRLVAAPWSGIPASAIPSARAARGAAAGRLIFVLILQPVVLQAKQLLLHGPEERSFTGVSDSSLTACGTHRGRCWRQRPGCPES